MSRITGHRETAYAALVAARKSCHRCQGLTNPADRSYCQFDSDEIGPWSCWQGNLHSRVMVVGQDWGTTRYFRDWEGRDQPTGNPTNERLRTLLAEIGYHIGGPQECQEQILFFTNSILCLKPEEGGLQGPVYEEWFHDCVECFFKPLLNIVNPAVVLTLGKRTSHAILKEYHVPFKKSKKLTQLFQDSPYALTPATVLFPLYHCGSGSINRNRSFEEQREDWKRIARWLKQR